MKSKKPLFVVGIGASAGGLDPIEAFFEAMPQGHGIAFVVVQHLSPDFKSLMQELLARHTRMEIRRAEHGMEVEAGTVYLIPPRKNLRIEKGALHIEDQDVTRGRRPNFVIDLFFESLAGDQGRRAIAVVLAGTGSDGSRGIRAINEAGGLVLVQDPATAQFDGMPRSAIATGCTHSVLPPDELARSIFQYAAQQSLDSEYPEPPTPASREVISEVVAYLKMEDGVDFSHYRTATIVRRMSRRLSLGNWPSTAEYLRELSRNPEERQALRNDLLIGVTSYFRDMPAWKVLGEKVLRPLIQSRVVGDPLRMWVTACSTGEEVYSLAILAMDIMRQEGRFHDLKVFATDIDKRALEVAALGIYSANMVEAVTPEQLQSYFVVEGDSYRVSRKLREAAIFAEHNLTKDAAFTNMDIVTCRNAMIYMEPSLQQRVLSTLHFSLRTGGTLFLGAAESLGELEPEFTAVDSRWKLYSKRRDIRLPYSAVTGSFAGLRPVVVESQLGGRKFRGGAVPLRSGGPAVLEAGFRALLHEKDAACFIVDAQGQLLHAYGAVSRFVRIPEGQGTQELAHMILPSLRIPLGAALQQARRDRNFVSCSGLGAGEADDDGAARVDLLVGPAGDGYNQLILVEDADSMGQHRPQAPFTIEDHVVTRIRDLEHELQQARESLQAAIEELEATNEEHQATNEELLASNEQLQSTNEELQSVNEELYTVNAEHQSKIQELTDLSNDMDNVLRSTQMGTLFLDSNLLVRKFTPVVRSIVDLAEQDIGRSIETFSHRTDIRDLWNVMRQVVERNVVQERSLRTTKGQAFFMRCVPYVLDGERQAGVIATFFDMEFVQRALRAQELRVDNGVSAPVKQGREREAGE